MKLRHSVGNCETQSMKFFLLIFFAIFVFEVSCDCSTWSSWSGCVNRQKTRTRACNNLDVGERKCTREVEGCGPGPGPTPCGQCPTGCQVDPNPGVQ